jgi:hypothetical protein
MPPTITGTIALVTGASARQVPGIRSAPASARARSTFARHLGQATLSRDGTAGVGAHSRQPRGRNW